MRQTAQEWIRLRQRKPTRTGRRGVGIVLEFVALGALAMLLLAGCSTNGSGGLNFSSGLAGSTADQNPTPPTIAANGPGGTYAFVYANQVWLRQDGQASATQLTHLVLSKGGTLAWGPLVWSPSGKFIAFALVQNLNPTQGASPSTAGQIYYVDVADANHPVSVMPATGSIYGHTYTWFSDNELVYSNGDGILLFYTADGDQNGDPRVYQVKALPGKGQAINGPTDYLSYSDVSYLNGYLYYTELDIRSPGRSGVVGSAELHRAHIGTPDNYDPTQGQIPQLQDGDYRDASIVSLGAVYSGPDGQYISGAWRVKGKTLVTQNVQAADAQAGTATSQICTQTIGFYFDNNCGSPVLGGADSQPWSVHPQLALAPDGTAAFTGDALYIDGTNGKITPAQWSAPAAWSPDGKAVAYTAVASTSTDSAGTTHTTTNVMVTQPGGKGSVLIGGAQNIAWQP